MPMATGLKMWRLCQAIRNFDAMATNAASATPATPILSASVTGAMTRMRISAVMGVDSVLGGTRKISDITLLVAQHTAPIVTPVKANAVGLAGVRPKKQKMKASARSPAQ